MTPPASRGAFRLLRIAAVVGMGLSLTGLGILLFEAVAALARGPFGPSAGLALLHPFREAGVPFVLCAILYAVCEIGLHLTGSPDPDE